MTLLTFEERKGIVKTVCGRLHEDGIERLKIIGHFDIYTPLFHYRLAEPLDDDFIFITELSGDPKIKPGLFLGRLRTQYHGNYSGLSQIIIQGIHRAVMTHNLDPSFRLEATKPHLTEKQMLNFDDSLKYLNRALEFTVPSSRRIPPNPETFSSTYHVI